MSRDVHVRFCEQLGGKLPGLTRLNIFVRSQKAGERVKLSIATLSGTSSSLRLTKKRAEFVRVINPNF